MLAYNFNMNKSVTMLGLYASVILVLLLSEFMQAILYDLHF
jgi:hypothetical protein